MNKNIVEIKKGGIIVVIRKIITVIKLFFLLPVYFVSIPILAIIHLISPWYLVRFENILSNRIGHFSMNTELYCCEIESGINRPKQLYIDLFYYGDISNKQLAKMWKRKLNIVPEWILSPIHNLNNFLVKFFPNFNKHKIGYNTANDRDILNLLGKFKTHLAFTEEEKTLGKKYLKKFGLSEKDKFVCLTVNDSSYLNTYYPYKDWSYHNYRNCNIDNYIAVSKELAGRGYFVFRMGKVASKPLKSDNHKIIDYANSDLRNDFMDIYLAANCTLCISASSGFEAVPLAFRKPLVMIVVPLMDAKTWSDKVLILTRHYFSKQKKKKLTLSEIAISEVGACMENKKFESLGIELIENSPEEIKDIAIEAVERLDGTWKSKEIDDKLQNKFWEIYYSSSHINTPRFRHGKLNARFGAKFLRENSEWLN